MKEFITLIIEKIGDDLYAWDLECSDLDFLKSNFQDTRNIGIAYYDNEENNYYKIFTSIKPRTKYINTIYTTNKIITEKDVILIEQLILQINKRYSTNVRKANLDETYYYIDNYFNIVEAIQNDTQEDLSLYRVGNYFLSKEEAKKYKDKIVSIFENRKLI